MESSASGSRSSPNEIVEGTSASIMAELREATATQHQAVEQAVDLSRALDSRAGYTQLLKKFLGLYDVLEPRVFQLPHLADWLPDCDARHRVPLLVADLQALNVDRREVQICHRIPPISTLTDAFGALYVLEGSTLGGQVISRLVKEKLDIMPEGGCMFFSGGGRNTGSMWKVFRRSLEKYAQAYPDQRLAIVAASLATFSAFLDWFATQP